jgi:hypothetical protein
MIDPYDPNVIIPIPESSIQKLGFILFLFIVGYETKRRFKTSKTFGGGITRPK